MGREEALSSILPFLPLFLRSGALFWPSPVVEALKALSKGPAHSCVDSGEIFSLAISDLRNSPLSTSAANGFLFFFDELIHEDAAARWFNDVVPRLARLLLELPRLLDDHYANYIVDGVEAGLRLLEPQQPGIVFLTQELVGKISQFLCLFPENSRGAKHLPTINFDNLFACIFDNYDEKVENKIKCITHYFERICTSMPSGNISFERKVLPLNHGRFNIYLPKADFWSKSTIPLCRFEVHGSGFIEDQSNEALEVDFANKYLGGGALHRGCLQEEIRFMINPELIAGMLFLPEMEDNEAIEIVGTERFSDYTGYAGSFRFCGDYVDRKKLDSYRRRETRIVAIDALSSPGRRQYRLGFLLREINKAFCGFLDQQNVPQNKDIFQMKGPLNSILNREMDSCIPRSTNNLLSLGDPSTSSHGREEAFGEQRNFPMNYGPDKGLHLLVDNRSEIGIATGNWGCGAFGGDPELKSILQWLASSQARRPFILYYTFHLEALQRLDQVAQWIRSHQWTVGELWDMLVEYAIQKFQGDTREGFFNWLLPSLHDNDGDISLHGDDDDMPLQDDSDGDDISLHDENDHDDNISEHDEDDDDLSLLPKDDDMPSAS
ncbi:hypothetical protein Leryth_021932 [Lithospermum erythrorhizon]|nr:hypothetical protein Leryth_021932 [Lithospermum erythrorhizon]